MSGLRIYINNTLKGQPDTTAHRIASNLANSVRQTASGLVVNFAKKSIYDSILFPALNNIDNDHMLALADGSNNPVISPYKGADTRYPVRNVTMFETNDKSVKILLYDVKIDPTFENTIVRTPVTKRRGTIKEFIQASDISLNVTGNLISNSQYGFPLEEFELILELLKLEENFSMYSVFSYTMGVHKVVLQSVGFPQSSQKYVNVMPFTLRLISDEDYELTIENEK
ncbi:MAG: DUF6046 domain-containing protein [Coriobacteriia bacterium]